MKICMVTTSEIYHDTRILNEAESLAKEYPLTIIARKYPNQRKVRYSFKIKLVDYYKTPFSFVNILLSFLTLMKTTLTQDADIYHAHDLDGLLCAFPAALVRRKKLIYDAHEFWSDTYPFKNLKGTQWLLPILERILVLKVSQGITVNDSLAKLYSHKYKRSFCAIYNKLKIVKSKSRPSLNLKQEFPGKKIVVHLGAADEGRGLEQIILAAKKLPNHIVVVFIGGGKIESFLKETIKDKKLENKVFLFASVLPDEIVSTVKQADLALALTQKISESYRLSLPNKIFQYMAAGVPILGSNFPEFNKTIITNEIGEVVNPTDSRLIAKKIISMVGRAKQNKFRLNLERLSKTKYNWSTEEKKLFKLYEKI